jgi:hypothetical protein
VVALVDELVDDKPGDFRTEAVEACQEGFLVFPLESLASPFQGVYEPKLLRIHRKDKAV